MVPYYDRDGIVIYHGDCRDVLPSIDPDSVDLLLTDPPYGINVDTDYSGRMHRTDKSKTWDRRVGGDDVPFNPSLLDVFPRRILWGANYYSDVLPLGSWVVWRKRGVSPVLSECEMAWHNLGGKRVSFFESAHVNTTAKDGKLHPTQKPAALMRWIVDRWTKPGDLVLDPYMGSGPVAQACHELGRRYIGVELVEDYCKVAVGRLAQQTLDLDGGAA